MRLYLSSFRLGDRPDQLVALLGDVGPGRIAVIANAMDAAPDDVRQARVQREITALTTLGFHPVELDLRTFFDQPGDVARAALDGFPAVWVRGGNAFMLRYALARSGADTALVDLLRRDALVYAGYSAGPCVLAPTLRGLELVDSPQDVNETWGNQPLWDGLGILDHVLVPHVDSPGHPETDACGTLAAHYLTAGIPHRTLRDGQALVIDGHLSQII